MNNNLNDFSSRMKQLRNKNNISQAALAKVLKIKRASVNGWEMGISNPAPANLIKLAEYFNVSIDYLLTGNVDNYVSVDGLDDSQVAVVKSVIASLKSANES